MHFPALNAGIRTVTKVTKTEWQKTISLQAHMVELYSGLRFYEAVRKLDRICSAATHPARQGAAAWHS
jgi:hypothetical protein